jgi:hypothetical protein
MSLTAAPATDLELAAPVEAAEAHGIVKVTDPLSLPSGYTTSPVIGGSGTPAGTFGTAAASSAILKIGRAHPTHTQIAKPKAAIPIAAKLDLLIFFIYVSYIHIMVPGT